MHDFGKNLREDAKRSWPAVLASLVLELIRKLLEHRILGAINEYIDTHSGPALDAVHPFLVWFVHTPFVLLVLTVCGILIHAYVTSRHDSHKPETSSDGVGLQTTRESVGRTDRTASESPLPTGTPVVDSDSRHKTLPDMVRHEEVAAHRPVSSPTHNVQLAGAKRITTDLDREVFDGNGIVGVKVCFVNKTIPGKKISDLDSATARLVVRDATGSEVAQTDRPKWLNHETAQFVDIRANSMECILVALQTNEDKWVLPCLVPPPPNYWDDGSSHLIVDAQELPYGELKFEITLASGDGFGLRPVSVCLALGRNGKAEIGSWELSGSDGEG